MKKKAKKEPINVKKVSGGRKDFFYVDPDSFSNNIPNLTKKESKK